MSSSRNAVSAQAGAPMLSAVAFFLVMTSYYIIRPLRDELGGATGSSALPLFYGGVFLAMLLLTPLVAWLMSRFNRRQLIGWSYSFFVLCLLAFVPAFMEQQRIGARELGVIFFAWVSVFNLFVVSLFWSFMADIFDPLQARRTFSLIAFGGMAGAVFGPFVTTLVLHYVGVPLLLVISALTLALAMALLLRISARHEARAGADDGEPVGGSIWSGITQLWSRPFLRYMALLMLFGDGIGTLAYALVADYVKAQHMGLVGRTEFFNDLNLATNLLGAALQLTLTPWLLLRRSAGWGVLVPALVNLALLIVVAALGARSMVLFGYTVPLLALMMVVTRGFAYGMTKPAVDALYTRVPRDTRYKGKNFVETTVWRFGDVVVTSAVTGLRMLGLGLSGLALAGAGVAALATWVAQRAGWSPDLAPDLGAGGEPDDDSR